MHTRKHAPGTSFPTPPGTCFVMPSLPYPDGNYPIRTFDDPAGSNYHPFVVMTDGKDFVECAMAMTKDCPKEGKRRSLKISVIENGIDIPDPCPPMDPENVRSQYTDFSYIMVIPKATLYDADLRVCDHGAPKDPEPVLPPKTMAVLTAKYKAAIRNMDVEVTDPFLYYDGEAPCDLSGYREDPAVARLRAARSKERLRQARAVSANVRPKDRDVAGPDY